ncbi:MAG TPA: hypothetical protein PK598_08450 [Thermoanaerobaculia bacterium]|nr:hypothetical protein [Thermoanaerobaculia bacterium]
MSYPAHRAMKRALAYAGLVLAGLLLAWGGFFFMFSRPFTRDAAVFAASRWTAGNRLFPTQIAVYPTRVVRYTPKWIGHEEQTISIDQIASVRVSAGLMFADVIIETTGGSQPIVCHGHWKSDAEGIREKISEAQAARPVGASR